MRRTLLLISGLLATFAAPAAAQGNEARATLYSRVDGDRVAAAFVVRINPTWYLYHTDLGHPDAIGTPLSVTFSGEGITWGELQMPKPKVKEVDDGVLPKHTVNYHTSKITAFVVGTLAAGATGEDVQVALAGLTCSDVAGMCIPYSEEVASKGAGKDSYWEDWPDVLGALPGAEVAEAPPSATQDAPTVSAPPSIAPSIGPSIGPPSGAGGDEKVRGSLYLRFDEEAETARAVVELDVADDFHIYHGPRREDLGHPDAIGNPTEISIDGGNVEWGDARYPAPERYDQGVPGKDIWIHSHHGKVRLLVEGLLYDAPDPEDVLVEVVGQVCDDEGCENFSFELESAGEGPDQAFAAFAAADASVEAPQSEDKEGQSLGLFLLSAVFWGIITLLMPCTYPMIPITISFFTKQAISRDGKVLSLALTYGAGIVAIFILIGVALGPVIIPFATHPVTNIVIGAMFLFFALVLFGFVNLQPPQALMKIAGQASMKGGYAGVFLMGATLVVTSFTCTAPFVGTLLGQAAAGAEGSAGYLRIVLGMGVFGLTMATPFVLLSLVPGKLQKMPQAGEWMNTLKVFLGFVEVAAALKFISNSDIVWQWNLLSREVFLLAWIAIFAGAVFYLMKKALLPRKTGGPVSGKLVGGSALTTALIVYMSWGLPGRQMDQLFTAILPNYSHNGLLEFFGGEAWIDRHVIVKDDFDEAKRQAVASEKLVLVNFTGFT